mgnify:CR=1 FL=1
MEEFLCIPSPSTDIKEVCVSVYTTLQQSLQSGGSIVYTTYKSKPNFGTLSQCVYGNESIAHLSSYCIL